MYGLLWSKLPGPVWVRVLICVALAAAVIVALALWVFPPIDALLTDEDVTF